MMADFPVALLPTTVFASGVNYCWQYEEGDGRWVAGWGFVWDDSDVLIYDGVANAHTTHTNERLISWAPFDASDPEGPDSEVVYPQAPRHLRCDCLIN